MENLEERLLLFEAQRNGTFLCSEDPWGRGKLARGGIRPCHFLPKASALSSEKWPRREHSLTQDTGFGFECWLPRDLSKSPSP